MSEAFPMQRMHIRSQLEATAPPVSMFISYSQFDENARKMLRRFLTPFERGGIIKIWDDRCLVGGEDWDYEIRQEIQAAELIVLLLSADFLESKYIDGVEMSIARERWDEGTVEILPVVVGPCQWRRTWLANLNVALNGRLVRGRRADDRWWNQFVDIILEKAGSIRPSRATDKEFGPITQYVQDIRRDYVTRTERTNKMQVPDGDFSESEFFPRLQAVLQETSTAVAAIAFSEVGHGLSARLRSLEVENAKKHVTAAIIGQVKAGKSTLLNALAGQDLSPRAVDAMTAFPIRLRSGSPQSFTVSWRDGSTEILPLSALKEKMEQLRVEGRRNDVHELIVTTPRRLLQGYGWIELLDTPGFDGWRREDTELTVQLISRAVVVVFVYRHAQATSESFLELVDKLRSRGGLAVFSICNSDPSYRDLKLTEPEQLERSMAKIDEQLSTLGAHHLVIDLRAALKKRLAQNEIALVSAEIGENEDQIEELESAMREIMRRQDILAFREAASRLLEFCEEGTNKCNARARELHPLVKAIESQIREIRDEERELQGLANAVRVAAGELIGIDGILGAAGGGGVGGVLIATFVTSIPILWPLAVGALIGSAVSGGVAALNGKERKTRFLERLEALKLRVTGARIVSDVIKGQVAVLNWESRSTLLPMLTELESDVGRRSAVEIGVLQNDENYLEYSGMVSSCARLRGQIGPLQDLDKRISGLLSD
jgi:ribosome biogenesis GTPase A